MSPDVSDATSELANRIARSGMEPTTHPQYPLFRLAFLRDTGAEPGVDETPWGDVHDVYRCASAPDVF
ncbi:hypothetical protein ACFUVV_17530 [Streptomyces sp. NPDC057376]|uniref:hypothetical protein n=1 Tax=Streptomyces sp. NPDC057376 TaxID=3346110 RepID=UPI0036289BA9